MKRRNFLKSSIGAVVGATIIQPSIVAAQESPPAADFTDPCTITSGVIPSNGTADDCVVENSDGSGLTIMAPDPNASIMFGDPSA